MAPYVLFESRDLVLVKKCRGPLMLLVTIKGTAGYIGIHSKSYETDVISD